MEVCFTIKELLDIDCRIVFVQDGSQVVEQAGQFARHFEEGGAPIMFGGGQYAYTLLGVDFNEQTRECAYCILDPHYTSADVAKSLVEKQAVSWKDNSFFSPAHFYNFCLPLSQ